MADLEQEDGLDEARQQVDVVAAGCGLTRDLDAARDCQHLPLSQEN